MRRSSITLLEEMFYSVVTSKAYVLVIPIENVSSPRKVIELQRGVDNLLLSVETVCLNYSTILRVRQ